MKILIVGAGAVGSAYGYYAKRGGADVSFLVKPNHTDRLTGPYRMYEYTGLSRKPQTIDFQPTQIFTSALDALAQQWDFVLLSVPSNALYAGGPWVKEIVSNLKGATLISLQPGYDDQNFILSQGLSADKLIVGTIPILSYFAPLPGQTVEKPGVAFWNPPSAAALWNGKSPRLQEIVTCFNRGGLKSKAQNNRDPKFVFGETLLQVIVMALRKYDWSFKAITKPEVMSKVSKAIQETIPVAMSVRALPMREANCVEKYASSPFSIRAIIKTISLIAPFSFEAFMKVHFTKVAPQMKNGAKILIARAKAEGLPHEALETLAAEN